MQAEAEKTARAMAALDTMATTWAASIDLRKAVQAMMNLIDSENRLIAFVKHCYCEGLYEGRTSHQDSPSRAASPLPVALDEQTRALIANLAAVVRVQNGNTFSDITALLGHADRLLDTSTTAAAHEWKGHAWNDQHHCAKCGQGKDDPVHVTAAAPTDASPRPLQGLSAYLQAEAGGLFVGHPSHEALMQWAREVEVAASAQAVPPVAPSHLILSQDSTDLHAVVTALVEQEFTVFAERDDPDQDWYIRMTAENGGHVYDGFWKNSSAASAKDVVQEAIRGAALKGNAS